MNSALASKATGYPLAFVAAKIALGSTLPELKNSVTKTTTANFEPSLDYIVTKIPRWDLQKFQHVSQSIGSSMKSVGEVMAIGRTWEESLQKAIRMVDPRFEGFQSLPFDNIDESLANPTDKRLFAVGHAMIEKGYSVEKIHDLTKIDKWFLYKLENIVKIKTKLSLENKDSISKSLLEESKKSGFSDSQIATCVKSTEMQVRQLRKEYGIIPYVKRIDTLASEFPAETNYLYTTYNASSHDVLFDEHGVLVLGSGVYRIGSSVEFDWCGVSCIRSLRDLNYKTIMINYNPETVSTDFDECDRLYFEELSLERVLDIYDLESAKGCIVSVGGQLPQNIALKLHDAGAIVLGTHPHMLDSCEDRDKFSSILDQLGIDQPAWKKLSTSNDAIAFAKSVGYPVLVRPSYVLSGAAMNVAYNSKDLSQYLDMATNVSPDHPIVISKFMTNSQELDIDAVAQNGKLVVYAVSQHIENAGVHSGDATLVLPPLLDTDGPLPNGLIPLNKDVVKDAKIIAERVANAFEISGPFNMQLILTVDSDGTNTLKVIECNLRASRSFPFVSKVLNVNFIDLATRALMNDPSLMDKTPTQDLMLVKRDYKAVKVPVFSWTRLAGADPNLGVEMASTGEVACFGRDVKEALFTAHLSNHNNFKHLPMKAESGVLINMDHLTNPKEAIYLAKSLDELGYKVFVDSKETLNTLSMNGLLTPATTFCDADSLDLIDALKDRKTSKQLFEDANIGLVISLSNERPKSQDDIGYLLRRNAVDYGIGLLNEPKGAMIFVDALKDYKMSKRDKKDSCKSWDQWTR